MINQRRASFFKTAARLSPSILNSGEPFSGIHLHSMDSLTTHQDDAVAFRQCLLNIMADGAVFLDRNLRVTAWNQRMEQLTGLAAKNILNQRYSTSMFGFTNAASNKPMSENFDPIALLLKSQKTIKGDYHIANNGNRPRTVQLTASLVTDTDERFIGCVLIFHDNSVKLNLQRQLEDLNAFSKLDPLTQVANRTVFERAMDLAVRDRDTSNAKSSLIICDIDFFKQVNDNYNHHVGDQTLVAFSKLLSTFAGDNDVLARFGGEEFVILCNDCDLKSAAARAESIRSKLTQTPMAMLDNKFITASFGVSELHPGDSSTDLFIRADTALIQAKEQGRNRVITNELNQFDSFQANSPDSESLLNGISWPSLKKPAIISDKFKTRTPVPVLVEKLRGFIVEMDAQLRSVASDHAVMNIEFEDPTDYARKGRFEVRIDFIEDVEGEASEKYGRRTYTFLRITIQLAKRKWFSTNVPELATDLLNEIRSYFMINNDCDIVEGIQPATESRPR